MTPVEVLKTALSKCGERNWGTWDLKQVLIASRAIVRCILKKPKTFDPEFVLDLEVVVSNYLEDLTVDSTDEEINQVAVEAEQVVRKRLDHEKAI